MEGPAKFPNSQNISRVSKTALQHSPEEHTGADLITTIKKFNIKSTECSGFPFPFI